METISSKSALATLAIIATYFIVMVSTNHLFTILDDESTIIAVAGHPVVPTLALFLSGGGQHEHPPASDIALHLWLIATNYSFFALRVFANVFFLAGAVLTANSAKRLGGEKSYWATLVLAFIWPFAFQYGRITGWYCFCMFLVSLLTWIYLQILEDRGHWPWIGYAATGILLVWSNYFGVAILLFFLFDFQFLHRELALRKVRPLIIVAASITASFVPLVRIALNDFTPTNLVSASDWKGEVAAVGYPLFSVFGSVAIAPWFLALSLPVFVSTIVLLHSIWFSPGRKWLVYFLLSLSLLALSGHINVKRLVFLLPWLFLSMGLAAFSSVSRYPRLALASIAVLVSAGWIGIVSGQHYATTNLLEPWGQVAQTASGDARRGATIISENVSFFFYLNYQLGLQSETTAADSSYLGEALYRSHGYKILVPDDWQAWAEIPRGMVVLVNGSGAESSVEAARSLNTTLRRRCRVSGEYRTAPDPALAWKERFAKDVPELAYRVDETWYDCSNPGP